MKISITVLGTDPNLPRGKIEIELPGPADLKMLAAEFVRRFPEAGAVLLDTDENLRRHLIIQVNQKRITALQARELALSSGDDVVIYPPVSGG